MVQPYKFKTSDGETHPGYVGSRKDIFGAYKGPQGWTVVHIPSGYTIGADQVPDSIKSLQTAAAYAGYLQKEVGNKLPEMNKLGFAFAHHNQASLKERDLIKKAARSYKG